ncbi:MAG TPA: ribbon-helix-helix protein, CopG family [Terriglobales bacterium]|nr:ribbon-helix-helix protein, CopG family [Terriglobales bacterium]
MKLTLELDSDLVKRIQILSAEEGKSVSEMLSQKLQDFLLQRENYDQAKERSLARLGAGLDLDWSPAASRDQLHER